MAQYGLQNENIEILVDSHGAELKSLKSRITGREHMWKGDPAFWGRTSPVLFPFVGGVNNKEYRIGNKSFPMNQHGFARDMEFSLLSQSDKELWFCLSSDQETLGKYPYEFVLKLGYRLLEDGVLVLWQVENTGKEEMPFAIGGHPAFNCPIEEGKSQTDYLLYIDAKDQVVSTRLGSSGLATEEKDVYALSEDGFLPITKELFDKDALVIEHDQAKKVALCGQNKKPYLTVTMEAPLFGIWSPPGKNAPFICIEPWYGRCDREGYKGELRDREWENVIAPGEVFRAEYQIQIAIGQ